MRRNKAAFAVLYSFSLFLFVLSSITYAIEPKQTAPDFQLPSLSGPDISLNQFKGKVVLLNFWATWCAPCREELPALQQVFSKYEGKGLVILGINEDKDQENARDFVNHYKLNFPIGFDQNFQIMNKFEVSAMPVSFLIDRNGTIKETFFGFSQKKLPHMESAIESLLEDQKQ